VVIVFLSLRRFPAISGQVALFATPKTGNLVNISGAAIYNQVYSRFSFVSRKELVTGVAQLATVTASLSLNVFQAVPVLFR
jgi:hypothetical protein